MSLETGQAFVDAVRYQLQDADGDRYTTANVLQAMGLGVAEMRRMRPDIFYGVTPPLAYAVSTDMTIIEDQFRPALLSYVLAYVEASDQESADTGRSTMYGQRFAAQMGTVGTTP